MLIVNALTVIFLITLSICLVYLAVLAIVFFIYKPMSAATATGLRTKFCILIPAHNEEIGIRRTLASLLRELDYPESLYDIIVIADNCTDETVNIVKSEGCHCLERNDPKHRGKGYALSYAFRSLASENYDAFVIVDADSVLSRNFLKVMDQRLNSGEKVIQAYNTLSNPNASAITYLFLIGNLLENDLFYNAKSRLGMEVNLRGNGMCFSKEILEAYPWNSYSITEDTEYGIKLILNGIHISFAPETRVMAQQPETLKQANMQRVRWASGNIKVTRSYALSLILRGILKMDYRALDAGLSLLVLSKPILLLFNLLVLALSVFIYYSGTGYHLVIWSSALLLFQGLYLFTGVLMAGLTVKRIKFLMSAPLIMLWFFLITVLGLLGYKDAVWNRTARS